MASRLSADDRLRRDLEREPTYRGPTRAVIPLSYQGALATYFGETTTCAHSCIEVWRGVRRCVNCGVEGVE